MGLMYGVLDADAAEHPEAARLGRAVDAAAVDGGQLRGARPDESRRPRGHRVAVVRAVAIHLRRRGGDRLHAVRESQPDRWPACSAASPADC